LQADREQATLDLDQEETTAEDCRKAVGGAVGELDAQKAAIQGIREQYASTCQQDASTCLRWIENSQVQLQSAVTKITTEHILNVVLGCFPGVTPDNLMDAELSSPEQLEMPAEELQSLINSFKEYEDAVKAVSDMLTKERERDEVAAMAVAEVPNPEVSTAITPDQQPQMVAMVTNAAMAAADAKERITNSGKLSIPLEKGSLQKKHNECMQAQIFAKGSIQTAFDKARSILADEAIFAIKPSPPPPPIDSIGLNALFGPPAPPPAPAPPPGMERKKHYRFVLRRETFNNGNCLINQVFDSEVITYASLAQQKLLEQTSSSIMQFDRSQPLESGSCSQGSHCPYGVWLPEESAEAEEAMARISCSLNLVSILGAVVDPTSNQQNTFVFDFDGGVKDPYLCMVTSRGSLLEVGEATNSSWPWQTYSPAAFIVKSFYLAGTAIKLPALIAQMSLAIVQEAIATLLSLVLFVFTRVVGTIATPTISMLLGNIIFAPLCIVTMGWDMTGYLAQYLFGIVEDFGRIFAYARRQGNGYGMTSLTSKLAQNNICKGGNKMIKEWQTALSIATRSRGA